MISLKKAGLDDREKAYTWLYFSDFSPFLNKLTLKNANEIPSIKEFEEDYENFYFDDSSPEKGRAYMIMLKGDGFTEEIGFITYTSFHLEEGLAEIDIWLKSNEFTGRGYGTRAVKILASKLLQDNFHTIIIRPCLENGRAVKSYQKAGFKKTFFKSEYYKKEYVEELGPGDCINGEDVFMELKK